MFGASVGDGAGRDTLGYTDTVMLDPQGVGEQTHTHWCTQHTHLYTQAQGHFLCPGVVMPESPQSCVTVATLSCLPSLIHSSSRPAMRHPAASASCKPRSQAPWTPVGEGSGMQKSRLEICKFH